MLGRGLLIVFGVCMALFVGEVGLRILDRPQPSKSGWRMVFPVPIEENQLGFRGQPIEYTDDDFVVVLLGDSQVEATACSYEWMPERRLEHYLNSTGKRIRVFSVGAGAYGTDQEFLALKEYLKKYRADLVVLWETPINDVWNNIFPSNYPTDGWAKPTFWLENGELMGPTEEMNQPIRESARTKLGLVWQHLFKISRDQEWEQILPPAYAPLSEPNGLVRNDWQEWWNTNARSMKSENLKNEKSHLAIYLTPRSRRMQYGLDLSRDLLNEIEKLAVSNHSQFEIFATDISDREGQEMEGIHLLNGNYYQTSVAQYRENVEYLNRGFDFVTIPVTIKQWRVGPENPHLNEHATDEMMKDVAAWLDSRVQWRK